MAGLGHKKPKQLFYDSGVGLPCLWRSLSMGLAYSLQVNCTMGRRATSTIGAVDKHHTATWVVQVARLVEVTHHSNSLDGVVDWLRSGRPLPSAHPMVV